MLSSEQIRVVSDCQATMLAAGWAAMCNVVFDGERRWEVQAIRGQRRVNCQAATQSDAWLGALRKTRDSDRNELVSSLSNARHG